MDRVYLPFYRRFMIRDKGKTSSRLAWSLLSALRHCAQCVHKTLLSRIVDLKQNLNAGEYDEATTRIFQEWDFDAILPCHGDFVPSNGKETLRRHLRLL